MFGNGNTYVSSELTAFSRRPLPPRPEAVSDLARIVLGDPLSLSFESSDILLAQELSRALAERCLYIHANDTYSSASYVLFSGGEVEKFEVLGWQGSDIYRSSDGRKRPEDGLDEIVARGWSTIGEGEVQGVDDLFDLFYSDGSEVISFVLMEKRERIWPPQQLSS